MGLSASPYSVFKAEDWMLPPASIGIDQCVRVNPPKRYPKRNSTNKKSGSISNKVSLRRFVQLAFA